MKKKNDYRLAVFIGILAVIGAIALFMHCDTCKAAFSQDKGDIVAEYNGGKIYADQLDDQMGVLLFMQGVPPEYSSMVQKKPFINQTIVLELLYKEAVDNGYKVSDSEAESMLENAGGDIASIKEGLKDYNIGYDKFIGYYAKQKSIEKYLNESLLKDVKLEDGEALQYYNQNKDSFKVDEQVRASHILVNTSDEAKEIISLLDEGEDFAQLAEERSIGPSAPQGGDLGYFSRGQMVAEFEDAVFALENIGDYSEEPVQTQYGYHVIELTGRQEPRQLGFEEVKEQIEQGLLNQKQGLELNDHLAKLAEDADIKIYLEETPATPEMPKSDVPQVELFVMSYCPYGTQIEKGILPVVNVLGDKMDFSVKFVNYAMHGEKEVQENLRQYCIEKDQNEKHSEYLGCFLEDSDSDRCLDETGIDKDSLETCMKQADEEFKVTENLNNKAGQFPAFLINDAENVKYGVRGSPTLVINGKTVDSQRDAQSLLNTICGAFNSMPDECGTDMSQYGIPGPGFGFDSQGSSTAAGCVA